MTTITREDVVKLAGLSNLSLANDEIASLQTDIGNILNYIEQLNELDTADVSPAYQVTGLENIRRADEVVEHSVTREDLLALAPASKDNHIKVPKVL
jgi:aspartyl-tRNA(Asn)/glutamyl-tRNA(Gln) amidotransferase subunit C